MAIVDLGEIFLYVTPVNVSSQAIPLTADVEVGSTIVIRCASATAALKFGAADSKGNVYTPGSQWGSQATSPATSCGFITCKVTTRLDHTVDTITVTRLTAAGVASSGPWGAEARQYAGVASVTDPPILNAASAAANIAFPSINPTMPNAVYLAVAAMSSVVAFGAVTNSEGVASQDFVSTGINGTSGRAFIGMSVTGGRATWTVGPSIHPTTSQTYSGAALLLVPTVLAPVPAAMLAS